MFYSFILMNTTRPECQCLLLTNSEGVELSYFVPVFHFSDAFFVCFPAFQPIAASFAPGFVSFRPVSLDWSLSWQQPQIGTQGQTPAGCLATQRSGTVVWSG